MNLSDRDIDGIFLDGILFLFLGLLEIYQFENSKFKVLSSQNKWKSFLVSKVSLSEFY